MREFVAEGGLAVQTAEVMIRALLNAEGTDRRAHSIRYQMGAARFPFHRDLASFDSGQSKIDEKLIKPLTTVEFACSAANVIVIGATWKGNTRRPSASRRSRSTAGTSASSRPWNWPTVRKWRRPPARRGNWHSASSKNVQREQRMRIRPKPRSGRWLSVRLSVERTRRDVPSKSTLKRAGSPQSSQ